MYYSYIEIEYVAISFSPARTDLALKLLTKLVSLNPQINNTCRKLRVSAFQRYKGWGVANSSYRSMHQRKGVEVVFSLHFEVIWICGPFLKKSDICDDSYVRSTERKSSPVLKTPRTQQSQLNNGFCQQQWANYCLAVLVQPTYIHACGTSTVNLANLVFGGPQMPKILAFDRAHKEITMYNYA
jgi:hypothetical protein